MQTSYARTCPLDTDKSIAQQLPASTLALDCPHELTASELALVVGGAGETPRHVDTPLSGW